MKGSWDDARLISKACCHSLPPTNTSSPGHRAWMPKASPRWAANSIQQDAEGSFSCHPRIVPNSRKLVPFLPETVAKNWNQTFPHTNLLNIYGTSPTKINNSHSPAPPTFCSSILLGRGLAGETQ